MIAAAHKDKSLFVLFAGLFVASAGLAAYASSPWLLLLPFSALVFYAGWHYREWLFYALLAALPFSFEYNFTASLGSDIPDELLMLLVSFVFLVYWLSNPRSIPKRLLTQPLLLLFAAMMIWLVLTVIFSTNPLLSLKFLLGKSWYAGAFILAPLILWQDKNKIIRSLQVLTGSMIAVTFISLYRHSSTGFSFATVNDALDPFFRNHVNYSAMLVVLLPVICLLFYRADKRNTKIVYGVVIALLLAALFFSYARGAWLALVAGLAAMVLLRWRLLFAAYLVAIAITVLLVFKLKEGDRYLQYANDYKTTIFHTNFSEHIVSTYRLKDMSTAERFYRWIAGVRMIKDNWLTGYGPNTFYEQYKPYTIPAFRTWVSDNPEHSTVHNYFLLTTIEQGVPGLLLLLILIGAMLWNAQRLYHHSTSPLYKQLSVMVGIMIVMMIVLNFLSDLVETDKIGSLFFLLISLLVTIEYKAGKTGRREEGKLLDDSF